MEVTVMDGGVHLESEPLFSIIIPVYNTVEYLPCCIDSILGQDFTDFELILVDDGSSDGSEKLCDDYHLRDGRIRCIHQQNAGVSSARNAGLASARGRFIWFCDSDDTAIGGALEAIARCIEETSPAMVAFAVEQVDGTGARLGLIPAPRPSCSAFQGPLQCDDMLFPYAHVFKRDLAEGERFDTSLSLLEDRDFLYRIAWKAAGRTAVIDRPLYRYLITRENSAVNSLDIGEYVKATGVQERILRNEEALGHVMPAFRMFASHAIGVLSLVVRTGSSSSYYKIVRGRLLQYRHYMRLIKGSLKLKFLLVLYFPSLFNMLTRLLGTAKGTRKVGSTVIVREDRRKEPAAKDGDEINDRR